MRNNGKVEKNTPLNSLSMYRCPGTPFKDVPVFTLKRGLVTATF
jgi:hypothetical protein